MNEFDYDVLVIGGGAAGYFGAIRAGEVNPKLRVALLEGTKRPLTKVKISGGGRCNVTHHQFNIRELVQNYPRGSKELQGAFSRFQPQDTVEWFRKRGVPLKVEEDGRMFPTTDDSETIINCLRISLQKAGVQELLGELVKGIKKADDGFTIELRNEKTLRARKILLATGSMTAGHEMAAALGHKVERLVPSLFTFNIEDPLLTDLAGISFPVAKLKLSFASSEEKFEREGPVLITHWGLSGPAVLKLSAFAAVPLFDGDYRAKLVINWLPEHNVDSVMKGIQAFREENVKKIISKHDFLNLSSRFWLRLTELSGLGGEMRWADASKKSLQQLCQRIVATELNISGKGVFKEEFVTCGGVSRKEVDFKTMESKICPGLYFAGEILDIDGITGGFNFQNAWTTSFIAGTHMAAPSEE